MTTVITLVIITPSFDRRARKGAHGNRRWANSRPKQILGPPLKGKYSQLGLSVSHRSGRNTSTSSPK